MEDKTDDRQRLRDRLSSFIDEEIFPCTPRELCLHAEENMAPDCILDAIDSLMQRYYLSLEEVIELLALSEPCAYKAQCAPPLRTQKC